MVALLWATAAHAQTADRWQTALEAVEAVCADHPLGTPAFTPTTSTLSWQALVPMPDAHRLDARAALDSTEYYNARQENGLDLVFRYTQNFDTPADAGEDDLTQWRVRGGLRWDVLDGGWVDRNLDVRQRELQFQRDSLDRRRAALHETYPLRYNYLQWQFARSARVEEVAVRDLLRDALDLAHTLRGQSLVTADQQRKLQDRLAAAERRIRMHDIQLAQLASQLPDSLLEAVTLPMFRLDPGLSNRTPDRSESMALYAEQCALEDRAARLPSLRLETNLNHALRPGADAVTSYPSVGVSCVVPIGRLGRKDTGHDRVEVALGDLAFEQEMDRKELQQNWVQMAQREVQFQQLLHTWKLRLAHYQTMPALWPAAAQENTLLRQVWLRLELADIQRELLDLTRLYYLDALRVETLLPDADMDAACGPYVKEKPSLYIVYDGMPEGWTAEEAAVFVWQLGADGVLFEQQDDAAFALYHELHALGLLAVASSRPALGSAALFQPDLYLTQLESLSAAAFWAHPPTEPTAVRTLESCIAHLRNQLAP